MKHINESSSSTIKEININSNYFKKKKNYINFEKKNFLKKFCQKCLDEYMKKKIKKMIF